MAQSGPEDETAKGGGEAAKRRVDARVLERLSQRVLENLRADPLGLDRESQARQLKEHLRRLMETDHYDLLGVEPGAGPEQVHAAFLDLARKAHPTHADVLGLEGWRAALDLLFERATEAYLVLSDAESSARYRVLVSRETEVQPGDATPPQGGEREREQRDVAQRNFLLARDLAKRGEFHFAVELLYRSVLIDPRPEFYRLLADCQAENPRWLDKAIDNYGRAIEGSPSDPDLHVAVAVAHERAGSLDQALAGYRAALNLLPTHQVAVTGLARVQQRAREERGSGPLGKLFDWGKG
jgi:tetratricopeptide (TPR) repeat protein